MSNHINEILFALTDAHVEFIISGGVAAVLHGVERVTLDVDLALNMEPANVEKFLSVMDHLGLQSRVPVPARDLMSREAVQRMIAEKGALVFSFVDFSRPLRHVDIFLGRNLSFEELNRGVQSVLIEGRTIKVVGIEKLLELKRSISPLRDKDLSTLKSWRNCKRVVKNHKTNIKPSVEFERALAQCTPEDFDGHTEFHRLTPAQRLDWLCQAATFVHKFKGKARNDTPTSEH